jgi:hypothetical protein
LSISFFNEWFILHKDISKGGRGIAVDVIMNISKESGKLVADEDNIKLINNNFEEWFEAFLHQLFLV